MVCAAQATAAPSWMGVYGSYDRHDGSNPGTYTVLMNQDYYGLHAEVGIRINGGTLSTESMTYAGNDSGNSVWTYTPAASIPPGSSIEYYFHGFDDWGANIWDNNGASNYTYTSALIASAKSGLGAWVDSGDTSFRVWAPNATTVAVAGTFNSWSTSANPLVAEAGGTWSVDVAGNLDTETYKYVIDGTLWKNDPRATDVTNSVGESIISAPSTYSWSSFTMPGWHDLVIYEMHIGTYNDTAGGNPGTWQTAISKLDHLEDMGINAVELLPIAEFAGDWSWGYNPAHPFAPESIYGDPDDLRDFVDECHQRGIAVIVDVVYNHLGPSDLDMWRFDGSSTGSYGGIYFFQDWRAPTPWGDTRPDYGRGEVRTYLKDNAMYWLEEFNTDGLRWDSTVNIRTQNNGGGGSIADGWSLMQYINNEIDSASGWKISIAEDLQNDDYLTKTTGVGGAGFDSQWDSDFVHPIRDAIIEATDANRDMYAVKDAIQKVDNGDRLKRVVYTESHDEVANGSARVPEEIWPGNASSWFSKKRSTLGAAIVFTSPGIPMIFQGQEFLEDGYFQDTDPIDFAKATTNSGIVDLYTDLIGLRKNSGSKTAGLRGNGVNVHHVNNTNKLVAYHRWDSGGSGDDVIIVANFSSTSYSSYNIGFPSSGTWKVRFNSDWSGYDSGFGNYYSYDTTASWGAKDGMSYNANVGIGPYSVIILSKD